MAFMRSFALLFVLATSVLAIPSGDNHGCSNSEFYYAAKDCCLPYGGKPHPPKPPHGKTCPPYDYYWHEEKSCCVPKHPKPPHSPPPQCERGHEWDAATLCCKPGKPTHTHHPKPSQTPKGGDGYSSSNDGYNSHEKKSFGGGKNSHKKRRPHALCPDAHEACPVSSLSSGDYECVDTQVELHSCGGCASNGKGQDCTDIEGAWNVGCEAGSCTVYTCELGYKVAKDGKSCTKY